MSLLLAQVDPRIRSISVPATLLGGACDAPAATPPDIRDGQMLPADFVWSAPLEVPVPPRNSAFVLLYPRFLHTTSGSRDEAAPAALISGAMRYARDLYGLGGRRDRVLFRADESDHNYGHPRREHTYAWFARTLLRKPALARPERAFTMRSADELAVNIDGTRTLAEELSRQARAERAYRFLGGRPTSVAASRAQKAAGEIFGRRTVTLSPELAWSGVLADRNVRGWRYHGEAYDVPVTELEGGGSSRSGTLLYLPSDSVSAELPAILDRARRYKRVVAVDYLGIGELASDRILLHTFARALMYAEASLPQENVALLRGVLANLGGGPVEIEAAAWAPALYAAALRALEPSRVSRLRLSGVPSDELEWLETGRRLPDLLLHPSLFARLTVAELS
jgi:hypothetical protein